MSTDGKSDQSNGAFNADGVKQAVKKFIETDALPEIKAAILWERDHEDELEKQVGGVSGRDNLSDKIGSLIRIWAKGEDLPKNHDYDTREYKEWWVSAWRTCYEDDYLSGFFSQSSDESPKDQMQDLPERVLEYEIGKVLDEIWECSKREGLLNAGEENSDIDHRFLRVINEVFSKNNSS